MKTSSAKAKGRALQKHVVSAILKCFTTLTDRDVVSTSMGKSGIDIQLSEQAVKVFPYAVECKNQESISIWKCWEQCKETALKEKLKPLLVIKRNNTKPLVVLDLEHFMEIV